MKTIQSDQMRLHFDEQLLHLQADKLQSQFDDLLSKPEQKIILDLAELKDVDSLTISALAYLFKHGKQSESEIVLKNVSDSIFKILEKYQLNSIFKIEKKRLKIKTN